MRDNGKSDSPIDRDIATKEMAIRELFMFWKTDFSFFLSDVALDVSALTVANGIRRQGLVEPIFRDQYLVTLHPSGKASGEQFVSFGTLISVNPVQ